MRIRRKHKTVIWMTRHMPVDLLAALRRMAANRSNTGPRVPMWQVHEELLRQAMQSQRKG